MNPSLPYHLVDFRSVVKHAFYSGDDPEALHCEKTDTVINTWQFAAQRLLERYHEAWFGDFGSPRHLIIAHDMGRDYRKAVFEGYKQKRSTRERSELEEEQIEKLSTWAKEFFTAIGATQIGVKGVEADDVLAWLCEGINGPKMVYSVDEDLLQLADDQTIVYLKMEACTDGEKKGVPYHLTSIAKSMLGDKSDEYGGVAGFGPVKFAQLLEAYGEDGIIQLRDIVSTGNTELLDEAIEATGDKNLIKLRDQFGEWTTMWKLASLHPELCWKPRGRKLTRPIIHKRIPDAEKAERLLAQAGANDMWPIFSPMMPVQIAVTADNWDEIRGEIFAEIAAGDVTAMDYETNDPEPNSRFLEAATGDGFVDVLSHEITGAAFTFGKHLENTIYVSINHKDSPNLPVEVIAELLEQADNHTQIVVQNAMFEGTVTQTNLGLRLEEVHDTRVMQRYWNENESARLKEMSKAYLNYDQKTYAETIGEKSGMAELTLDEVFDYGTDDGIVTGSLYDLLKLLLQVDGQWDFYRQWAVRPTEVLQHSYINGVDVDWGLQKQIHEKDAKTLKESMARLREVLAENVNGEVTAGCKSYLKEEMAYVVKGIRRKLRDEDGLEGDALDEALAAKKQEWIDEWEAACVYRPYSEEAVMPKFSPTPKQLSAAAESVGLPPIEKASARYLTDYLMEQDMLGAGAEGPEDERQRGLLEALLFAMEQDVFKAKKRDPEKAQETLTHLGDVVQTMAGVEPKIVSSGDELSLGSPKQVQKLLYCKIGVPVRLFGTSLGKGRMVLGIQQPPPSTDEKAILTALANDVEEGSWREEALKLVLSAKNALTKIQLYHNKYPMWIHHKDGKVHPSFTDAGTDTRRPTGSSPNVLQVSKKDKEMRQIFVPPDKDWVVVAIDYASQEIRLMACEANDPVMKSVYDPENEKDLHSMTGSGIAKMPYDAFIEAREDPNHKLHALVEGIRNKKAKGVNFGLAYGAGSGTVSRNLIVPVTEAQQLLDDAFSLYARIKPWQEETAQFMAKHGYTLTAFGTKRHATDDLFSSDHGKVSRQQRQGTNATIQGTAAEMLRIVLTKIAESGMLDRLQMVFFAPIYDEVVSFLHKDDVVSYCREMRDIMSSATPPKHDIPQVPEFSIGDTWGTVKELGRWPGEEAIEAAVKKALEEKAA